MEKMIVIDEAGEEEEGPCLGVGGCINSVSVYYQCYCVGNL